VLKYTDKPGEDGELGDVCQSFVTAIKNSNSVATRA